MSKKVNKNTKAYKKKIIRRLQNRCLKLWCELVKVRAGNKCETSGCGAIERLNAHHIESYSLNPGLRYEPVNGLCLCPKCHKFGRHSAHKSYIFMHRMHKLYPVRFESLIQLVDDIEYNTESPEYNEAYYTEIINKLSAELAEYKQVGTDNRVSINK